MHQLPTDILRLIALNLSIRDILNLCQTNKQYQQYICNNKPFWKALLLRETKGNVNISPNADVNWYKEKIKNWPSVKVLVEKIEENKVEKIEYIQSFQENWDYFEIAENLQELYCSGIRLTSLPSMPNLGVLDCQYNLLTSLPLMPKLQYLYCHNNQLTSLPPMLNLRELDCQYNLLTSLPSMPNLQVLSCKNNLLPSTDLKYWRQQWNQ